MVVGGRILAVSTSGTWIWSPEQKICSLELPSCVSRRNVALY